MEIDTSMRGEWSRLATFKDFDQHKTSLRPIKLAKLGLFYNSLNNSIICYSCRNVSHINNPQSTIFHLERCILANNESIQVPESPLYETILMELHKEFCCGGQQMPALKQTSQIDEYLSGLSTPTIADNSNSDSASETTSTTMSTHSGPDLPTQLLDENPGGITQSQDSVTIPSMTAKIVTDDISWNTKSSFHNSSISTNQRGNSSTNTSQYSALTTKTPELTESSNSHRNVDNWMTFSRAEVERNDADDNFTNVLPIDRTSDGFIIEVERTNNFDSVAKRLATFKNWPSDHPTPRSLAEAGFKYLGSSDRVQCILCNGILTEWENGDIPIDEHERWFPDCEFVRRFEMDGCTGGGRNHNNSSKKSADTMRSAGYDLNNGKKPAGMDSDRPPTNTTSTRIPDKITAGRPPGGMANGRIPAKYNGNSNTMSMMPNRPDPMAAEVEYVNPNREVCSSSSLPTNVNESETLKQENERLQEENLCVICMANPKEMLILPCAHLSCCSNCITQLRLCPVCRSPIKGIVKTYIV